MSDNTTNTPPKPKPGSLRDRIAAFENKAAAASSQPAGPPPPRPKPAGFATWKPKQPSPPDSPSSSPAATAVATGTGTGTGEGPVRAGNSGMSAVDAKESITRAGGSLKERMAALQGRGGFGAPVSPPTPPKPTAENRPKWKPPPQVVSPPAIGEDDDEVKAEAQTKDEGEKNTDVSVGQVSTSPNPPSIKSPPPIVRSPESGAVEVEESGDTEVKEASGDGGEGVDQESGEKEVDEEEEERQRRAAIAARMAKLGGARIGMGPPVFGRPAVPPPSKKPSLPPPASVEAEAEPPKVEEGTRIHYLTFHLAHVFF